MTQDDPFGPLPDPDRTILIPTPGTGRPRGPEGAPSPDQPGTAGDSALLPAGAPSIPLPPNAIIPEPVVAGGLGNPIHPGPFAAPASAAIPAASYLASALNPLVRSASALFDLVAPLRQMTSHADVSGLRIQLIQGMKAFETQARADQIDPESIASARYALCTLLDETVAGTPWGGGVWGQQSLLVHFHNEASGGEKFFLILQRLAQNPSANIDALEFFYLCLSLGLQGRYRLVDNGQEQLGTLRERLSQMIRAERGHVESELSPRWVGVQNSNKSLARVIPLWVYAAAAVGVLAVVQLILSYVLNGQSDQVFNALHQVKVAQIVPVRVQAAVAPPPKPGPGLAEFLAPDIARKLVTVQTEGGRTKVSIRGDGLFASGSVRVQDSLSPLLGRIAEALRQTQGKVVVVGHTDNIRIVSSRYPSNWHLSHARARSVLALLTANASTPKRFRAEGRGAAEPLVANSNRKNRARNRRVEIIIESTGQS